MKRFALNLLIGLTTVSGTQVATFAQQTGYQQTNLVSNVAGIGKTTDPQLANPWGISILPGQDFWIANNKSGTSTLYDNQGNKDNGLVVTIPAAQHNPNGNCNPGCPTATVSNGNGSYFGGGQFLFATVDGLITSWTGTSNTASVVVDNSASGAVYKGLAVLNGTVLLTANFNSGKVEVFDRNFNRTSLAGSFTDPNLAAGFAPHSIHVIGNQVFVAYAMQDGAKHDAQPGAGLGQVDLFDTNGNFVSTFVPAGGRLNAPWGIAATPATFGQFANAVLIGNFGDGTINAYDTTGKFLGQLADSSNHVLVNAGLWELTLGQGGTSGDPGTLYFTAGGSNQPNFPAGGSTTGVFASLAPAAAAAGADFSLRLSTQSAAVTPGGSTNLTISASAVGGFNGQISLSCSSVAGITCAFNPATISPGSSTASSTLTISATSTPPVVGYGLAGMLFLPGVIGTAFMRRKRQWLAANRVVTISALSVILLTCLLAIGCGSSSNKPPAASQTNLVVTGTSGSLSHSSAIAVTIN